MSIGSKLEGILKKFEERTEGVLGLSVIDSKQALVMAEVSSSFPTGVVQGTSAKIMDFTNTILKSLLRDNFKLKSVLIEEENILIYVRQINESYNLVVITNREEVSGLREMNIKSLTEEARKVLS